MRQVVMSCYRMLVSSRIFIPLPLKTIRSEQKKEIKKEKRKKETARVTFFYEALSRTLEESNYKINLISLFPDLFMMLIRACKLRKIHIRGFHLSSSNLLITFLVWAPFRLSGGGRRSFLSVTPRSHRNCRRKMQKKASLQT